MTMSGNRMAAALLGVALVSSALAAQEPLRTPGTIQYPSNLSPGATRKAIGLTLTAMPAAIVQEAASIRWPLFTFDMLMGLPNNFSLAGAFSTQLVTNHLEVGPHWQGRITDRLRTDLGVGGAFWFGRLKRFGFDNTINGTFLYPTATVGYDFGTMALSAQARANIVTSLNAHSGSLESQTGRNAFSGMSWRVSLEQTYRTGKTVGLSVAVHHLQFYYPQWPLFPTFAHRFWIPEAQIRVSL